MPPSTPPPINAPYSALSSDHDTVNLRPESLPPLQAPPYPPGHHRLLGAVHPPGALFSFTVLFFINLLNFMDRYIPSATKSEIRAHFQLNDFETSFPLTVFILVYMCCCPVFGYLSDKGYNRKWLIAVGVISWSILTAATALAPSYAVYTVIRGLVGVGEASYATIAPAILSDWYRPEDRSIMLGYFYVGVPVGAALGYGIGGVLGQHYGWRIAFVALGLPGVLMALLFLKTVDPPRGATDSKSALMASAQHAHESQWRAYSILLRNPIFLVSAVGLVLSTFGVGGLADWFPVFMQDKYPDLSEGSAGLLVGGVTVVGGIGGSVLGSWLGEKTKGRLRNRYLAVSGWGTLIAAIGALLIIVWTPPIWVTTAVLVLAEIALWLYLGPITALVANVVATRHRTRAFALQTFSQHALGDALSPSIIGALSDATTLQAAVLLIPVVWLLSALVWVGGAFVLPETHRMAEEKAGGADMLHQQENEVEEAEEDEEEDEEEADGQLAEREGEGEAETVSYITHMGYAGLPHHNAKLGELEHEAEGVEGWRRELLDGRVVRHPSPPPPPYSPPAYM